MAAPISVDEFLDLVRKSGVADEKKLDAYLAKARGTFPPEPAKVAGLLVHNAVLTNFQAENILAGKWRRFTIGKYKVLERLGSGGFAQVYLCEHKLMRRRVAVKVLPVAKAKDSSALERFYREARAAAALDHANIVHAYDIDQDEDLHFLVMEYVDGANLQEIVKRTGPLSVARACHYIFQAALGLQHAHEHSLVHRDIKPGNILVDRTGCVKVLDMGLALIFSEEDEQLTKKHDDGTLGTADYLSPEQAIDSHDVDIRTDIYSLGVTFYFLLTGKAPFEGMPIPQKLLSHQMKVPRLVSEIRNDAPAAVLAVLMKMMEKHPRDRYTTPGEVAQALEPFVQSPIAPPTEAELPRLSPAAMGVAGGVESDSNKAIASGGRPAPTSGSKKGLPPQAAVAPTAVTSTTPQSAPTSTTGGSQSDGQTFEIDAADADIPVTAPKIKRSTYSENRTKIVFVTLIAAFVVIPFILVVTIGVGIYVFFPTQEKKVLGPSMLDVSKDPANKKAMRTIQQAIKAAEIDSVITLLDDAYEENVVIEPGRGRTAITIKAAVGKEIIWKPSKFDPETPILRIYKGVDLKLVGAGITLDGTIDAKRRVNDLLTVSGDCSGLIITDLQFRNYERSAVFVTNGTGSANRPVLLKRLTVFAADSPKARGAFYFDANPAVTPTINDFVQIDEATFHGIDAKKAVQFKDKKVMGSSITWPGQ